MKQWKTSLENTTISELHQKKIVSHVDPDFAYCLEISCLFISFHYFFSFTFFAKFFTLNPYNKEHMLVCPFHDAVVAVVYMSLLYYPVSRSVSTSVSRHCPCDCVPAGPVRLPGCVCADQVACMLAGVGPARRMRRRAARHPLGRRYR